MACSLLQHHFTTSTSKTRLNSRPVHLFSTHLSNCQANEGAASTQTSQSAVARPASNMAVKSSMLFGFIVLAFGHAEAITASSEVSLINTSSYSFGNSTATGSTALSGTGSMLHQNPTSDSASLPAIATSSSANYSGASYALSCNNALLSYSTKYAVTFLNWTTHTTTVSSYVNATPYTTYCDGIPRAHGNRSLTYWLSSISASSTVTTMPASAPPAPSCTFGCEDCSWLWESYSSVGWDPKTGTRPQTPPCQTSSIENCVTTATASAASNAVCKSQGPYVNEGVYADVDGCAMIGSHVRLAYWPVSTVPGNLSTLCDGGGKTYTNNATSKAVATVWGTAVTSPTVYVSFSTLYAVDHCGFLVGTGLSDYILPVISTQISTRCGYHFYEVGQLNYADLQSPVPWSAYTCMTACGGGQPLGPTCSTIFDDDFAPVLDFPEEIYKIHPAWSTCTDIKYGNVLYDPPTAITPADAIATAILPTIPSTTAASPSITVATVPSATSSKLSQGYTPPSSSQKKSTSSDASAAIKSASTEHDQDGVNSASSAPGSSNTPSRSIHDGSSIPGVSGSSSKSSVEQGDSSAPATSVSTTSQNMADIMASIMGYSESSNSPSSVTVGAVSATSNQPASDAADITFSQVSVVTTGSYAAQAPSNDVASSSVESVSANRPSSGFTEASALPQTRTVTQSASAAQPSELNLPGLSETSGTPELSQTHEHQSSTTPTSILSPTEVVTIMIASQPIAAISGEALAIGSTILSANGPEATISGHVVSVAVAGVVVDSTLHTYANANPVSSETSISAESPIPEVITRLVFTAGSSVYTASALSGSSSVLEMDDGTIALGGPAVTVSAHTFSLATDGVVVDNTLQNPATTTIEFFASSTSGLQSSTSKAMVDVAVFTASSSLYTASLLSALSGAIAIHNTTLSVNGPAATIAGVLVSAESNALYISTLPPVVVNTSTTSTSTRTSTGTSVSASELQPYPTSDGTQGQTSASSSDSSSAAARFAWQWNAVVPLGFWWMLCLGV